MYTIIKNATIIDEGKSIEGDILIKDDKIEKIGGIIDTPGKEIDATNQWVIPGIIDDQVHFREPGLTHKGEIYTEARAAVAGGVTAAVVALGLLVLPLLLLLRGGLLPPPLPPPPLPGMLPPLLPLCRGDEALGASIFDLRCSKDKNQLL